MLAKRAIIAAFAVFVVVAIPFAFPGQSGLLVDTPPGLLTMSIASN